MPKINTPAKTKRKSQLAISWRKITLFLTIAVPLIVAAISGLTKDNATQKDLPKPKKDDSPEDTTIYVPADLLYSKCTEGNTLQECVTQVCEDIGHTITPLNRIENTVFLRENPDKQDVAVFARPGAAIPKDPKMPGGKEAFSASNKISGESSRAAEMSSIKLIHEMEQNGLDPRSEAGIFLRNLIWATGHANIPDCAGMTSQVVGRLLAQPIAHSQTFTASTVAVASKSISHTFAKVQNATQTFICDSWLTSGKNKKARVCNVSLKEESCAIYSSPFWNKKDTIPLHWPNLSGETPKVRRYFRHTAAKLLRELNPQRALAKSYHQRVIQGYRP